MTKHIKEYVKEWRKNNNASEIFKERYRKLRENGFDYNLASQYKFRSDKNIDELITNRLEVMGILLKKHGFNDNEIERYKFYETKKIELLIKDRGVIENEDR